MDSRIISILYRSLFFIGWLLSPLTFWNDVFVNIPLAYFCASLAYRVYRADFLLMVLCFYWLSNLLGLVLMYVSGRKIAREEGYTVKALIETLFTVLIYSVILATLNYIGILKPFQIPLN